MARVSVVIPVFNGAHLVDRAIASALNQTVPVHEIVVVNDGSTDDTAEVLRAHGDRIRVISIPNGGVAHARNVGLAATTGELIALLDADDEWHAGKTESQLEVLRRHPSVEFVCCNFMRSSADWRSAQGHFEGLGRHWSGVLDRVLHRPWLAFIAENSVGTCSNVMFSRRLLERVGLFDVQLKQAEDYDLWLRMSLLADFYLQSAVLLEKVVHEGNLTNRFDETLQCHEAVLQKFKCQHEDLFAAERRFRRTHAAALAQVRYDVAGVYFAKGRRSEGYGALRASIRADGRLINLLRCSKRALRRLMA